MDATRTSQLDYHDLPEGFVSYSVIATTLSGGGVPDPIWGWEMQVLGDGFLTVEDADEAGQGFLTGYAQAAGYYIRESVKEWKPGFSGWKAGRTVKQVRRTRSQIMEMVAQVKRDLGPSRSRPNGAPQAYVEERLAPLRAEWKTAPNA